MRYTIDNTVYSFKLRMGQDAGQYQCVKCGYRWNVDEDFNRFILECSDCSHSLARNVETEELHPTRFHSWREFLESKFALRGEGILLDHENYKICLNAFFYNKAVDKITSVADREYRISRAVKDLKSYTDDRNVALQEANDFMSIVNQVSLLEDENSNPTPSTPPPSSALALDDD